MKCVCSLNCVSVSLRKELIWHLTHLLVFLHQSLIFELLVRSLQAPWAHCITSDLCFSDQNLRVIMKAMSNMFSTVNQQAFGGEEGLLVGEHGGIVERMWVTSRGNTMIHWWRDTAAISFQAGVSVLNRFILPVQAYPLYCVSKLSSSTDIGEKENKKWPLVAPTVDSIHRLPVLHPVSGWMSGFCVVKDKSQGRILTRSLHHTLSQASKQGEHRWQEKARTRLSWGLHETSEKT